jgi:hypothetical protein
MNYLGGCNSQTLLLLNKIRVTRQKKIKFCFRKERAALYSHRKPKVRLNGLLLDYMEATSGGVSLCFTLPAAAQYIVAFLALVKKKSMLDTSL